MHPGPAHPPLDDEVAHVLDDIAELMHRGQRLFVVTGAGMSADSGLPTYRGVGGLYNSGQTEEGMPIEVLLSGPTFRRRPELTWKYLGEIERAARTATYNRGHWVLARMDRVFESVCVLTQNIDGFHLSAGSRNVIEIHGNLHRLRCPDCGRTQQVATFAEIAIPPYCDCGQMMRPDVVLFEEMLPAAALDALAREWEQGFDMVFTIGTSSVFPYIAEPVRAAQSAGRPVVEINPSPTSVSALCSYRIRAAAAPVLDALWQRIEARL